MKHNDHEPKIEVRKDGITVQTSFIQILVCAGTFVAAVYSPVVGTICAAWDNHNGALFAGKVETDQKFASLEAETDKRSVVVWGRFHDIESNLTKDHQRLDDLENRLDYEARQTNKLH